MRNALLLAIIIALLAACDGGGGGTTPNQGHAVMGFVNTRQAVEAQAGFAPVVGKAVRSRTAAAGWEFRLVTPAYADTAVVGAPAAGVEACFFPTAESQNGGPLNVPMCKTTGSDGKASFTFPPGVRAATYRLPACVKGSDGICTYPDTVVLVVLPKAPVSASVSAGDSATYGSGGFQFDRVTFPAELFKTADGTPAAYRVEGAGALRTLGDTLGTVAARQLVIPDSMVQVGDSAVVTFHGATKRIGSARARLIARFPRFEQGTIWRFTFTEIAVP